MRILFWYPEPGQSGAVSNDTQMLEAYCEQFPQDELTVMCTQSSPLTRLARFRNCRLEIFGRYLPREAYLLGVLDLEVWRLNWAHRFDVFWSVNIGHYLHAPVPHVLTVNNSFQVYPPDIIALHPRSEWRVLLLRKLFRRSLRLASAAVVQTPLMKTLLHEIPGCPTRVTVVPKAVAPFSSNAGSASSPRISEKLSAVDMHPKLLYVATGYPHKNHKLLAEMMSQLRRKGSDIRLVITTSADEWRTATGHTGSDLVESGYVLPLGWINTNELEALYSACDVCVMPSLLESLSSSHLEAMYWKRPQIAADLPYAHDLCGDAALYAPASDASVWISLVERLLSDKPLQNELVARGTERLNAFPKNWAAMTERIRSVLAETATNPAHDISRLDSLPEQNSM